MKLRVTHVFNFAHLVKFEGYSELVIVPDYLQKRMGKISPGQICEVTISSTPSLFHGRYELRSIKRLNLVQKFIIG